MAGKPLLKIAVYSDIACPWCYIGKKRLDQAIKLVEKKAAAQVEWHAFLLDPSFGASKPIDDYGQRRFGPGFATMKQRVIASGVPDGAAFADWKWRSNTIKGHMLVALARAKGRDHDAAELLFRASYEQGADVSDSAVLLDIASQLGLGDEAAQRLGAPIGSNADVGGSMAAGEGEGTAVACDLDGTCTQAPGAASGGLRSGGQGEKKDDEDGLDGELLKAVETDDMVAKSKLQVTGVPFFLISAEGTSRRYALSGAQPVESFVEVFDRVMEEAAQGA